jgi:HPt (histidine-containing phosphotransfer) domain-containing protein
MDDYLSKPLRVNELQDTLRRHGINARPLAAPGSSPATASIIDVGYVGEMQALAGERGPSLWRELVLPFFEQASDRLQEMEALLRDRRPAELAASAHHFAGSCASVGAVETRRLALEVEKLSNEADWAGLAHRVPELRAAHDRFLKAVSELYPSL